MNFLLLKTCKQNSQFFYFQRPSVMKESVEQLLIFKKTENVLFRLYGNRILKNLRNG